MPAFAPADAIVLDDGKTVNGQITYEDDEKVMITTQDYGPLTFKKYRVKQIQRPLGGSMYSAPGAIQPAAAGSVAGAANPFGGPGAAGAPAGGAVNPFGGVGVSPAPAAGAAPPGGAVNPFGVPAPEAAGLPAGGAVNPFGAPAAASDPAAGAVNPFGSPGAPAAPVGGAVSPFGGPGASADPGAGAAANPFGGLSPGAAAGPAGGAVNPFGGAGPAPAPGPVSANPFAAGAGMPPAGGIGAAGAASPFTQGAGMPVTSGGPGGPGMVPPSVPAGGMAGGAPPAVSAVGGSFTIPTLPSALETDAAPDIPAGYDGVLYGIGEGFQVDVRRSDAEGWIPAGNGTPLQVRNEVRTGEGKAKIRLRGRDSLRLPPRSHIALVELSIDASQVTIEVKNGSLWTEVAPRARVSDFKVVTPDLTAGVRGTLFKTMVETGAGSRVAVLKDTVEVTSQKTGESTVVAANKAVVVNPQGQIEPPMPVLPAEYDEWTSWEDWRLDFHKNVASFSAVGAPILQGMADQIARDNAQYEATMNEANRNITINKFEENLKYYAGAFMRLAEDTGRVPDPDRDGWQVLRENKGNWAGWNGPYVGADTRLPPVDIWQRPIHYTVRYGRSGGNIHGLVYSEGINRRDDKGNPASDDMIAYAMFFRIQAIADSPEYQGGNQAN